MRLKEKYETEVVPAMIKRFGYSTALAVPKMVKVSINSGTGKALKDEKLLEAVQATLTRISGQRPALTKARKSISAFKIRAGMTVGVRVTLRGSRMYDFVEKLIHVSLPRVRDFQGLDPKSIDQYGNLSIGFKEHVVFPEIRSDEVERTIGLEVTITTNSKTREEGTELLTMLGFPFKKD
ncbi:MAG: 50S ribosomal protein L5 [Patescibacteria group bacterium]